MLSIDVVRFDQELVGRAMLRSPASRAYLTKPCAYWATENQPGSHRGELARALPKWTIPLRGACKLARGRVVIGAPGSLPRAAGRPSVAPGRGRERDPERRPRCRRRPSASATFPGSTGTHHPRRASRRCPGRRCHQLRPVRLPPSHKVFRCRTRHPDQGTRRQMPKRHRP